MPRLFIIACEPSGDAHGAKLVQELKRLDPSLECRGLGGPKMQAAGVLLLHDMTTLSALGFGDVLRQYFKYRKIFYAALADIEHRKPDVIVLIDSPAFNLRFAEKINRKTPVLYYVSPQIWAWAGRRIHVIKKTVTKMLLILPFEKEIYDKACVPAQFIGHPLLDELEISKDRESLRKDFGISPHQIGIALLPGSRESEVRRIFPLMLESAFLLQKALPESLFWWAQAPNVPLRVYNEILKHFAGLRVRRAEERIHDLVYAMDFALITSGTATLEAALIGTPFFLFYKAGWSTYILGKCLIRVPFLGMANLLAGKRIVPEFIQSDIKPQTIAHEAEVLLKNRDLYEGMKREFAKVREMLGEKGASARAARAVMEHLKRAEGIAHRCGGPSDR